MNTLDTIIASLTRLADDIYKEGGQFIDAATARWHARKEWAAQLRIAVESLRPSAVEAAPKVCGTCLGRGRRDIAHGESVPSPPCNGTGIVPAPASTPAAAPAPVDGMVRVPQKMYVDPESWEAAQFAFGGPGAGEGESYMPCTLWVGEIEGDDGEKTYGLHVSCDECPEEGSITLAEFAAPTSAPTPDRATPGERDALSALRKLAAKAAPGPYEYDSEHCTIVGNGHCPDCDDGCRHVHVDIEPSDLAFIIAAANYVSASLPQPIASSEAAPAVQCANCGDSKQEFSWNGDGPYPCRHCKQPSEAAHGEEEVEVLYRRDITEDGPWVRYSDYLKRQPAAAPGAVDDGTVARIAELIVAEMPSETVIQRCVASAVNKAALAALATKPDGPRADGGES